jgi:hypothetical protein
LGAALLSDMSHSLAWKIRRGGEDCLRTVRNLDDLLKILSLKSSICNLKFSAAWWRAWEAEPVSAQNNHWQTCCDRQPSSWLYSPTYFSSTV